MRDTVPVGVTPTHATCALSSRTYSAPGNILDWMYMEKGVKYSYAVHLRDTGTVRPRRRFALFSAYV